LRRAGLKELDFIFENTTIGILAIHKVKPSEAFRSRREDVDYLQDSNSCKRERNQGRVIVEYELRLGNPHARQALLLLISEMDKGQL
jgi:hypothetical protein